MTTRGILSHWRESLGLSQPDMARLLAMPLPTYRKWESGDRKPPAIAEGVIVLMHWLEQNHPTVFSQIKRARLGLTETDTQ